MAKSTPSLRRRRVNPFVHVDEHLARILSSLANLLLRHGYGHSRLARLTKVAFVDAARSIVPKLNSKANIARIAALTGLTRVEVSRILKTDRSAASGDNHLNRATRVAAGWRTDKRYLNKRNQPRPLALSAPGSGFSDLVKNYSGDIPARAMLAEMLRLGLVARGNSGLVTLIRDTPALPDLTIATISAIAPWVNLVADAGGSLSSNAMASRTQQIRIHFDSLSEVVAAIRELDGRQRSFEAGIQQLGTRPRRSGAFELTVSVGVATTRPLRSIQKKQ